MDTQNTLSRSEGLTEAHSRTPRIEADAPAPAAGHQSTRLRQADLKEGYQRLQVVLDARKLRAEGVSWRQAGEALGKDWQTVRRWCLSVQGIDQPTAEHLTPKTQQCGRKRQMVATDQDKANLKECLLITNRTATSGSSEEAARMALRKGLLSEPLAEAIRERDQDGRPLLTEALRREIAIAPATVKQHRNPTDAGLDYLDAPGSTMWFTDQATGEERFIRTGDTLEADDATINFVACIPWEVGGCRCSDRWGVKVGRFQWLVSIDAGCRVVPGFSYTARPKSSYRAEDILSLLHGVFTEHGLWQQCRFEQGSWKSHMVTNALDLLGVDLHTVWSPHQKPFIEGLFNLCWTKLSEIPGQVGRFRGEEQEMNRILTNCTHGAENPLKHFPMLNSVIEAFDRTVRERNNQRVKSRNYGSWIPQERWDAHLAERPMRKLDPASEWMFSPCQRRWQVKGNTVGGSIQIMEGFSVRYDFGAEWLTAYHGTKVLAFFDPASPQCSATIVLAENTRDRQAGEILGTAMQVNKVARYARRVLGWGDDADLGNEIRRKAAIGMRRDVRTIRSNGEAGLSISEARDGLGNAARIERHGGDTPRGTENPAPVTRMPQREERPTAKALPRSMQRLLQEEEPCESETNRTEEHKV